MFALPARAQSGTASVFGTANIFLAGGNGPGNPGGGGAGTVPNLVTLHGVGTARTLTFGAVTGSWGCAGSTGFGPDGSSCAGSFTNVLSSGKIAGIQTQSRTMFLVGVFLGAALPGTTPDRLTYATADLSDATFAPALGQVFFIGDGRTGTGAGDVQEFVVPLEATRLYLGVADAFAMNGAPGYYQDNPGVVDASYAVVSAVPEPSSLALAATGGLALLGWGARRRRARG